jgi:hypothetical protein
MTKQKHIQLKLLIAFLLTFTFSNVLKAQLDSTYFEVQTNENGDPMYFKHQIIIAFSPDWIKKSVVDNKSFIHGKLSDFFTEDAISIATGIGLWNNDIADAPTSKIYPFLDSDDTLSITRSGETITIPKYWATFLVYWPLNDVTPIMQICDSLNKFYPIIEFAHPNYLYKLNASANDTYYQSDQFNLHPNPNWTVNGNINLENAWDIETGSNVIKLGIYDTPIIYTHEDFKISTLSSTIYLNSKIKGGKVYYKNAANLSVVEDISTFNLSLVNNNHGTQVAGIAAAVRNNEKGIAGVAGGDFTNGNNGGVSLYTFGIMGAYGIYCGDNDASAAITEGATYILQPNGSYTGYGLDIQNHSWGGPPNTLNIKRAIKDAARNQCILVCSRGNDQDDVDPMGTKTKYYPATYNDEWVISVGASGNDKKRLNITAGNVGVVPSTQYPSGTPRKWSSMYGEGMDVLAPGSQQLLITTHDNSVNPDFICQQIYYCYFNGTSAAAPHVSGLAGLLLSKYRPVNGFYERLEPEDIENLIEKNALHHAPSPSFYNDEQGWGLINPDNTLDKIKNNKYKVYHFTNGWPRTETNMGNITINVPVPTAGNPGLFRLSSGSHVVQKWKIEETYTNTFGSSEQILGRWPRLNATNGLKDFSSNSLTDDEHATYSFSQSGSTLTATATTYAYYHINDKKWLNYEPNKIKTAYSVHTYDPTKSSINEKKNTPISLKLFPNPASKEVTIELSNQEIENVQIIDMNGKVQNTPFIKNTKNVVIDTSNLKEGIYICKTNLVNGSTSNNKIVIIY